MAFRFPLLGISLLLVSTHSATSLAQQQTDPRICRPLDAHLCSEPPSIDGDLTDKAWSAAPKAETFVDRTTGAVAAEQTVGYITYDDKFIYVAFDCKDAHPDQVTARETVRDSKYAVQHDENPNKEDNVTFTLDPYLAKKPGDLSVFSVNALGTPSAQIAGGRGGKLEWKGNWIAAAKRTADGYAVEMRIPWEMLNYPSTKAPCCMGINFFRYQYRTKIETVWSNVTNLGFTEREGLWNNVTVPQRTFKPQVSLLPYVLPGIKNDKLTFRSGLDARVALTPNLTYVGSLNPDFNTIEGAVESIAFSRAERFIPEKRPFFLEGEGYFSPGTRFNDIGAYFYARRVPTFDLGTKVYGKVTPTDSVGLLNTVTFGDRMDTVLRYRHDLSATSDVGFFVSQKSVTDHENSVAMVDQHARFGALGLESQFAKSWGADEDGGAVVLSANYQRGNNISLLQYHTVSDNFIIENGFIPYRNYEGYFAFTDFFGPWRHGPFRNYDYGGYGIAWDHQGGARYQRGFGFFGSLITRSDWKFSISQDYAIVDDTVDSTVTLGAMMGASNRFRQFGVNVQFGRFSSIPATYITPVASVRLFRRLDLAYAGSILNLDGVTRQHTLTAGYELSPTRSFGGRLVCQDSDTNWYLSYRNSGGRGTNFYVIVGDPNARTFQRQLQLKFVFAF
ncbi:MAG: hypothetical protein JSS66_02780 [Armatimonadetes bacterium]|nr:hypothetical protein [Armatimonadota bacterium]